MRYLLVNFGGPRSLAEIPDFLTALLSDQEVLRTPFPGWLHRAFFRRIAQKRAKKVEEDYAYIGGRSPIYQDTECLARLLEEKLRAPCITFHRYLPDTHKKSLSAIEKSEGPITAFPLFPQFCSATTGSCALFLRQHLSRQSCEKIRWIRSYPEHPGFVMAYQRKIASFLEKKGLKESEVVLLFSPHGIPESFVRKGDSYQKECEASYRAIASAFPQALSRVCYQSKFGPGKWLRPYTEKASESIRLWHQGKEHVIFIPLSFTSDHIETLFEIERLYLPLIAEAGLFPYRLDALNLENYWIEGICSMLTSLPTLPTCALLRRKRRGACCQ
ncbi:MAG: ferrochelatase [Chlamydiota bacterium]